MTAQVINVASTKANIRKESRISVKAKERPPSCSWECLCLAFVVNYSFVDDQEADEEKEARKTKNQSHGKVKTREWNWRVEDVVSYTLPNKTDDQADDVDDNQIRD